jgi:hypothetical protein
VGQYASDLLNSVPREFAAASPTAARNGLAEDLFKPASTLFRDVVRIAFFDAFLQPGAVCMRDVL